MSETNSQIDQAIVMATYNEAVNLKTVIGAIRKSVPGAVLIVVDDNSPDGSPALLAEMAKADSALIPIIRSTKDGYGGAMFTGFLKALELNAAHIATLDADFSHDPAALPDLFKALDDSDVAIGSRYSGGVRVLNWHPSRLLLSLFANRYVRFALNLPVADATSGFRAYRRSAMQEVVNSGIQSKGYSFLVEVLYRLVKKGYTVVEVPIIYTERREGQSKMSKSVIFEAIFRPWILRLFGR